MRRKRGKRKRRNDGGRGEYGRGSKGRGGKKLGSRGLGDVIGGERWRTRRKNGVGEDEEVVKEKYEMDKKICRRKGKMRSSCRKRRLK